MIFTRREKAGWRRPEKKGLRQPAEGEHDADAGASLGLLTTTAGGTGAFSERYLAYLAGRPIVIVAHGDAAGRAEAEKRAALLHGKGGGVDTAATVKVVEVPGSKDLAEAVDKGFTRELFEALVADAAEWRPATGADLLEQARRQISRFVVIEPHEMTLVLLWIAHTHVMDAVHYTPYLLITSPVRGCGKTNLLDCLECLVARPLGSASVTGPSIYRAIQKYKPTLLLDEIDTVLKGNPETVEAITGILNGGYRRGKPALRVVGTGANQDVQEFETFCAKALAGIKVRLPASIVDRCLPIRMKKAPPESVEPLFVMDLQPELAPLEARLAAWGQIQLETVRQAKPERLEGISGRDSDICYALLGIADTLGEGWSERARRDLKQICQTKSRVDEDFKLLALMDMRLQLEPADEDGNALPPVEMKPSRECAAWLAEMEERPWAQMPKTGKVLSPSDLARLLREFDIHPVTQRYQSKPTKVYRRADFLDAWARYGNVSGDTTASRNSATDEPVSS